MNDVIEIPKTHKTYTAMEVYYKDKQNITIYSGQDNGDIYAINAVDYLQTKKVQVLRGHQFKITSFSFIGKNKDNLVSGTEMEGHLYIWDIK